MKLVGFDPGGKKAFGWCVVTFDRASTSCVGGIASDAEEAFTAVTDVLKEEPPAAVGIDAPLFWVSSEDRRADSEVRKLVRAAGGHNGTVAHVNSLRGACLAQGILIARKVAGSWPDAAISEAHPKALLKVCEAARKFAENPDLSGVVDHMRDAALAAFAADAMANPSDGWHDLALHESSPFFPAGAPVHYWFPQRQL